MEKLDKTLYFNKLLATYGSLLSSTQYEILSSYYHYDLSISEIANERGISRAAVEDALQKGTAKLEEYETKLNVIANNEQMLKKLAKIKEISSNSQQIEFIEEVERRLK